MLISIVVIIALIIITLLMVVMLTMLIKIVVVVIIITVILYSREAIIFETILHHPTQYPIAYLPNIASASAMYRHAAVRTCKL